MKYLTLATISLALSLALAGCGNDHKSGDKTPTSTTTTSSQTSSTTSSQTGGAPAAKAKYTVADYVKDNNISQTPVRHGDPGPSVDLPVPTGWQPNQDSGTSWGSIVQSHPANPSDPPTISSLFSKLTGSVDPAKVLQYAPGEVQNLPGFQGGGDGSASTLGGFQAWQLGGTYEKGGKTRVIAQKTVVIPSQGAVYVLRLSADGLEGDQGPLIEAASVIDAQTTITG
ncbi:LpqN/LpqT family lipoprotein [Mycobacterium sp. 852002-10029_SCH5224772]|uniref:LpqN/LpqT family lipoprotein n=1 Tax=Mycobacterium sp. 852002-10029_SCH5224772 TaxID=1834083 RepID=UPI0008009C86|nr:LpqN/LpqT family lipoprotein [Mycobacterium sp. 852002-10029_SCH5224772]OBF09565.1 hypothetical protein A5775_20035 [Mycobacterium sp. 852002-10029_SCH5224772]